ncbi:alpha-L-fucosidase [Flavihumibacter solisilvae]|uniref:alpha-L-fucosidase n=1 Tax=Flavihumibacter solisilvae TaxID=1349421 RepID=A0A0C1IET1_9BACT|nr:alpha-L-fucosidase [Flavihumibacter solisilvae]
MFFQTLTAQQVFQPTWESLKQYSTPDWFQDAKFGIFIHWGVYSVPAFENEWYPRSMYQQGSAAFKHHREKYGDHKTFGYKDFIPMFKAEKFNAEEWLTLFKNAGAKYIVPVAEHHDGFAMYNTALSKWNASVMGPKRDIIGELATATNKAGLVFGVSSHRIEHWWFMNGGRKFESDVLNPEFQDFYGPAHEENETMSPEFMNDWLLRCTELTDKYHPQLFWFDWWIEQPALEPYRKSFAAYYYNKAREWGKGVVINNKYEKAYPEGTTVLDIERGKLADIRKLPWQTDDAASYKSWGYIPEDSFKSVKYLVNNLVDIVSKNGCLLLNIGPRPDGSIPEEAKDRLLGIGKWLQVNGEAIYGTRPWKIFGEGPTQVAGGAFSDAKDKPFTAEDIRFTVKGEFLYAISLDVPMKDLKIRALGSSSLNRKIETVELLGSNEKIKWTQNNDGLLIRPVKNYPAENAVVYKLKLN